MYVTLEQLAFSYKDCDRVYDTWQCMWHLCNFPILTMYVTVYMIPDNVCDITENILFLTRYVTGYMTPDNICDISVNILLLQGMWQGIWHLTIYVIFQEISFSDKVCDGVYDTWQYMWHFSKYPFLTMYITREYETWQCMWH